ncbi:MAG: hypothetical protein IKY15_00390 [Clostridia bacterium]|nr:hypothetical protein [Clostridia bacterium]
MADDKKTINIEGLMTPVEKMFAKKILDIKAQNDLELELLKQQNALLKEQVLRLTQIQEVLYKQLAYGNSALARALEEKHKKELNGNKELSQ